MGFTLRTLVPGTLVPGTLVPGTLVPVMRNIARNKKNSVVIALLVAAITFLFFTGNSIIERSNAGLHKTFIGSITGDVVLEKKTDVTMNLFGANTPVIDSYFVIPPLPAYDTVMEIVCAEKGVAGVSSQVSGKAYLDLLGVREPVLLCGVDAASYFPLFSGIVLEEGRFLQAGEYGAMITAERALGIQKKSGQYPKIGELMLLTSGGTIGFKIREIPLVGIFNYQNPGLFMNEIVIIDPQTVRVLNSIQVAGSSDVELSEDAMFLLNADPDDIFGGIFGQTDASQIDAEDGFSADMLINFLAETDDKDNGAFGQNAFGGDWNFIILRLKDGVSTSSFINSINKKIESYGVVAVDWRTAAGTSAILLLLIQALFNAGMFLVCVAGVITAINIILISVFRRTREIGTLRAIGASDSYICLLIIQENFVISAAAAFAGIFGGFLFLRWINALNIHVPNELLSGLLGDTVLKLEFLPNVAAASFILAVVLGLVSSVYPIYATLRIEPMAALRRG